MLSQLRKLFFYKVDPSEVYRRQVRREAGIGGGLFGPVPEGRRREFFCLDERTWVWHEEWHDELGKLNAVVTRYDVYNDRILRAQDHQPYQPISDTEARRLYIAIDRYNQAIDEAVAAVS